jgi:predicted transcriptional regulator
MHGVVDCKILYFYTKCRAMLTKTQVLKAIKQLPDNFSIDEMVDKMILLEKIEIGLAQSERGEVISDESLDKEISKWFD